MDWVVCRFFCIACPVSSNPFQQGQNPLSRFNILYSAREPLGRSLFLCQQSLQQTLYVLHRHGAPKSRQNLACLTMMPIYIFRGGGSGIRTREPATTDGF